MDLIRVYNPILDDKIAVPSKISSIVTLDPGATETIFMLGLGSLIKATDAFSYRPPDARILPKIGSYTHVNYQLLEKVKPDLIFTSYGAQKFLAKKLIDEGYTVYPLPVPFSLNSILDNILLIGNVIGAREMATKLQRTLSSLVHNYTSRVRKQKMVYVELDLGGPITVGYPTHINHAIETLGAKNIFGEFHESYFEPMVNVIQENVPDVIIYEPKRLTDYERERFKQRISERGLSFLLNKKIVFSSGDFLAHLGPTFIINALPWLASVLSE